MKLIFGSNEIEILGLYNERVSAEGAMRDGARIVLSGGITNEELTALAKNNWTIMDEENVVDERSGYNTLSKHEVVYAKIQTKQEELDEAVADVENILSEATGGAVTDEASAQEYNQAVSSIIDTLDDASALEVSILYPIWKEDMAYYMNQRIRYDNILYKCLQDHTSLAGWEPTNAPSLWAKVVIEDPNVIYEWVQPDNANPYMTGDKVSHNDKIWVSIVDNNVWEPGVYGWEEVIEEE